jgi:hypothetical protein
MAFDPNKAWALFMSDPVDCLIVLGAVGAAAWAARAYIGKERIKAKDDLIELARAQRDELARKVTDGEAKLSEIKRQIANEADDEVIAETVSAAEGLFKDAKVMLDTMRVTLTPTGGVYQTSSNLSRKDFKN